MCGTIGEVNMDKHEMLIKVKCLNCFKWQFGREQWNEKNKKVAVFWLAEKCVWCWRRQLSTWVVVLIRMLCIILVEKGVWFSTHSWFGMKLGNRILVLEMVLIFFVLTTSFCASYFAAVMWEASPKSCSNVLWFLCNLCLITPLVFPYPFFGWCCCFGVRGWDTGRSVRSIVLYHLQSSTICSAACCTPGVICTVVATPFLCWML